MVENGGAKDFIFTCIFRSISFTGSKFNENLKNDHIFNNKLLIILKTYVHYYVIDLSTKIKCKDGGSYFYKNQKYRRLEIEKKKSFQKFLIVPTCTFSENAQCFVGAPL